MATVTLNIGYYAILGFENNEGRINRHLMKTIEFETEETPSGPIHWVKFQKLINLDEMQREEGIHRINSRHLSEIPIFEVLEPEHGQNLEERFTAEITSRENLESTLSEELITMGRNLATLQFSPFARRIPEEDQNTAQEEEVEDIIEEDTTEETVEDGEAQETVREPSFYSLDREPTSAIIFEVDTKQCLTMDGKDLQNFIILAEKQPQKMFPLFDCAIKTHGHVIMKKFTADMRDIFIQMKLDFVSKFAEKKFQKFRFYHATKKNNSDIFFEGMYLGDEYWFIPEGSNFRMDITDYSVLKLKNFRDYNYEKLQEDQRRIDETLALFSDIFPSSFNADMINFKELTYLEERDVELDFITKNELGKNWEKAIIYHYFLGGDINIDKLEIQTFEEAAALKVLAEKKNDAKVLERLR